MTEFVHVSSSMNEYKDKVAWGSLSPSSSSSVTFPSSWWALCWAWAVSSIGRPSNVGSGCQAHSQIWGAVEIDGNWRCTYTWGGVFPHMASWCLQGESIVCHNGKREVPELWCRLKWRRGWHIQGFCFKSPTKSRFGKNANVAVAAIGPNIHCQESVVSIHEDKEHNRECPLVIPVGAAWMRRFLNDNMFAIRCSQTIGEVPSFSDLLRHVSPGLLRGHRLVLALELLPDQSTGSFNPFNPTGNNCCRSFFLFFFYIWDL